MGWRNLSSRVTIWKVGLTKPSFVFFSDCSTDYNFGVFLSCYKKTWYTLFGLLNFAAWSQLPGLLMYVVGVQDILLHNFTGRTVCHFGRGASWLLFFFSSGRYKAWSGLSFQSSWKPFQQGYNWIAWALAFCLLFQLSFSSTWINAEGKVILTGTGGWLWLAGEWLPCHEKCQCPCKLVFLWSKNETLGFFGFWKKPGERDLM